MATLGPRTTYREEHARGERQHGVGKARARSQRGGLAVGQPGVGDVQIAFVEGFIAMRSGERPDGPSLVFAPGGWRKFVLGARGGKFGLT